MAFTGYNQGVLQDFSNPQYLSQLAAYLSGEAAPTVAASGLSAAQAQAQAGTVGAGLAVGEANQNLQGGYQLASDLLDYQGTQLQEQGLAQQAGTAAQQQAIEQQQYGGQQAQLGLREQGTALSEANLAYQTPIQYQKQGSAAATTGATNSQGNKQATQGIQQQAAYQGSQLQLQAQNEYIQGQLNQLGQQSEQVGYQGQQEAFGNQYQQLELAAKQAGIPVQQLVGQTAYGLNQLGVGGGQSLNQFLGQAATGQAGEASAYGAVGAQIGAITGQGAQGGYQMFSGG